MLSEILKPSSVITIVGSGGKTTTMYYLAEKFVKKFNKNVMITTTTKIFNTTKYPVIITKDSNFKYNKNKKIVIVGGGLTKENKITSPSIKFLKKMTEMFSLILIEGDGSKGKPLKAYKEYEPVIPDFTDTVITVVGMDVIGEPFSDKIVHRFEIMKKIVSFQEGTIIGLKEIVEIIKKIYFKVIPDFTENFLLLNRVKDYETAEKVKKYLLETKKFKKIFLNKFKMINSR